MSNQPDIERLKNFFGGYFHEDWPEDATDVDEVLNQFFREGWTENELRELSNDISEYAQTKDDDSLGDALFRELGCYYQPSSNGMSARAWLTQIASSLKARADGARGS